MADSPHAALLLPEILSRVFKQVIDLSSLISCALVCRRWTALATEALWRDHTPDMCDLESMLADGTLARYLPFIRSMNIHCSQCDKYHGKRPKQHMALLKHDVWSLSKATTLHVHLSLAVMKAVFLESLIQSNLHYLDLGEGFYGDNLLAILHKKAPNLKILNIDNRSPEYMTLPTIFGFLKNMPRLKEFVGLLRDVPNSLLLHLADRKNLEFISIDRFESRDWATVLCNSHPSSQPFNLLNGLEIHERRLTHGGICQVFRKLRSLQRLSLSAPISPDEDIFLALAHCTRLRYVDIVWHNNDDRISYTGIITTTRLLCFFATCSFLRHVSIRFLYPTKHLKISGSEFQQLARNLRRILVLQLPLRCVFGLAELQTLMLHCPLLYSLTMHDSSVRYAELLAREAPVLPVVHYFNCNRDSYTSNGLLRLPAQHGLYDSPIPRHKLLLRIFPALRLPEGAQLAATADATVSDGEQEALGMQQ